MIMPPWTLQRPGDLVLPDLQEEDGLRRSGRNPGHENMIKSPLTSGRIPDFFRTSHAALFLPGNR